MALPRGPPGRRPGPYSTPNTRTDPASGSSRRLIVRRSVDLPDPDGPKITKCSPWCTVRSTPWSTSFLPNDLRIPSRQTTCSRRTSDCSAIGDAVGKGSFIVGSGVRIVAECPDSGRVESRCQATPRGRGRHAATVRARASRRGSEGGRSRARASSRAFPGRDAPLRDGAQRRSSTLTHRGGRRQSP